MRKQQQQAMQHMYHRADINSVLQRLHQLVQQTQLASV
jgi:hypothetical protein